VITLPSRPRGLERRRIIYGGYQRVTVNTHCRSSCAGRVRVRRVLRRCFVPPNNRPTDTGFQPLAVWSCSTRRRWPLHQWDWRFVTVLRAAPTPDRDTVNSCVSRRTASRPEPTAFPLSTTRYVLRFSASGKR